MKFSVRRRNGDSWLNEPYLTAVFDTVEDAKAYIDSEPHLTDGFNKYDYFVTYNYDGDARIDTEIPSPFGPGNELVAKYSWITVLWYAE